MHPSYSQLSLSPKGLMLAGHILAKRTPKGALALEGQEARIQALLIAAYGKPVSPRAMNLIKRAGVLLAEVRESDWDSRMPHQPNQIPTLAKAQMMLALAGLGSMEEENLPALEVTLYVLHKGVSAQALLKAYLRKDDDDDDEDDEDDNEDDDDDTSSGDGSSSGDNGAGSGNGGYNPDEPRDYHGRWTTGGISTAGVPDYSSGSGSGSSSAGGALGSNTVSTQPTQPAPSNGNGSGGTTQVAGPSTPVSSETTVPAGTTSSQPQNTTLPTFSDLWHNYPTYAEYPTNPASGTSIWNLIGGNVAYNGNNGIFQNSCAIRLSDALNESGYIIPQIANETVSGGDKEENYFYRVKDMTNYLQSTFGAPDIYDPATWKSSVSGQTGIVLFQQQFSDASGHFELYDGSNIINYNDPNNNHDYTKTSKKVLFWPVQ